MKRFIPMIIVVVITIGSFISIAAAEQTDFSAYEIRDRFTPVDIYMLNGNSFFEVFPYFDVLGAHFLTLTAFDA